jgi:hypothetical protein
MNTSAILVSAIVALFAAPAYAGSPSRRATITGARGPGRCIIEVNVDGSAQVEIVGDTANLTTLSSQPAAWRRFECSAPVPRGPADLRLGRISGRGSVRLVPDPRNNRGVTLIHISDPQSGRSWYSLELVWQASGGWGPPPPASPPWPGHGGGPRPVAADRAIRACQDSVTSRLSQDGFAYVTFESTIPHDNPGRSDWITGSATARRGASVQRFSFSCSADLVTGAIRSVDVRRW